MADNHVPPSADTIDARGLACPLPVLKLRKALKLCAPGTVLTVLATDPAAARDVPAFCVAAGHEVLTQRQDGAVLAFRVRCG